LHLTKHMFEYCHSPSNKVPVCLASTIRLVVPPSVEMLKFDKWYHCGIIIFMAMTLRLNEEEQAELEQQAKLEGTSMQETVKKAIKFYVDSTSHRTEVFNAAKKISEHHAEALKRLGE